MLTSGYQLFNTSITAAVLGNPVQVNKGFGGCIVVSSASPIDPALNQVQVVMQMGSEAGTGGGSGYVIVSSSKVLSTNSAVGPIYFPPGTYRVRTIAGSTITNLFVGIYSTL